MSETKRLFLLDAYALIFRSYYAFIKNPRVTSKGLNTSAVFGFLLTLEEVLNKQNPTHLAVAFDTPSPTFRHEIYREYKANRSATPEDIIIAVPYIKRLLDAYRIPIIECPGFEADDVIGTLQKKASESGFETYMMTPDKDYAQLVSEKVFMFKPSRSGNDSILWGVKDIQREFSVSNPLQVIDLLALMGDSSDNIPGAPGVGPKTASKLISEYGSVEDVIANCDKLNGKLKDIIRENSDKILLSKELATIRLDVPLELNEKQLEMCEPDYNALNLLYEELEFKTFAAKISSRVATASSIHSTPVTEKTTLNQVVNQQPTLFDTVDAELFPTSYFSTINETDHNYILITDTDHLKRVVDMALSQNEICIDTETTDIDPLEAALVAISLSWDKGSGYLVHFSGSYDDTLEKLEIIRPLLENNKILKVGQNIKFDMQVLANYGIEIKAPMFDTMIAHYLLEPDTRHNMNALAENYLNYSPVHIESLIGEKKGNQKNMREVPLDKLTEYAVEDADITYQLKKVFAPRLENEKLISLFNNIEMPLIGVLASMERKGVILDKESLKTVAEDIRKDIITLEQEIYQIAGMEFNISSPKQLGEILFIRMKLDEKAKTTKTKQFVTNEEALQRLKNKSPIIDKVLDYRGLRKLLSTYVDALPALINPRTGRIHTSFNQAVAATGRLSSNNPNLQNIPIREERGRFIRKAFVPQEGSLFLSADYSQVELRLMAHLSKDSNMIADFLSGNDIHSATASKIFGVPVEEVTREMRAKAKTANFGIIYGISAFGLSERLGISRTEAKELIDGYFNNYPGVKNYMDESIAIARKNGYVTTMFGRKRELRDIASRNQVIRGNAERNAINAPIQGSAADIIKIAMINIHNRLKSEGFQTNMILQVHDELIFEVPYSELEKVNEMVINEMSNATELSVPLIVESGSGKNWLEAH
jgi:DNA polymerase-1